MKQAGRKHFFFEKKKQKTFITCPNWVASLGKLGVARNCKKFFGSFFQKRTFFLALPATYLTAALAAPPYIHAEDQRFVGSDSKQFNIRGISLGNWLVPEGYMFHFHAALSPHEISAVFRHILGEEGAARFWTTFRDRYITEADIALIHRAGFWTLMFLLISLAITPLRRIARFGQLVDVRRMIGVGAFCYGVAHISLYILDQMFDLATVASEIAQRVYLTIGFTAWLGLAVLAVTSTDGMVRELGGLRWRRLHQLAYVIAVLALSPLALGIRRGTAVRLRPRNAKRWSVAGHWFCRSLFQ